MTLNQMRYFREVCDNNANITKAAQGLHISQPALSKAIRELEDELDVQLLRRSKQHAQLTREGAWLAEYAKKILAEIDEIPSLIKQQRDTKLMLGIHASLSYFVFDFIGDFADEHPDITILMNNASRKRQQLVDEVISGQLDTAMIVYNSKKNRPDDSILQILDIKETKLVYVVDREHPLASSKSVTYEQISQYPIYGHVNQAEKKLAALGIKAKLMISSHDLRMMSKMLRRKEGGGAILLRELAQTIPDCVVIELVDAIPATISIIACRNVSSHKAESLSTFLEYIEKNKEKMRYLFDE